MEEAKRRGWKCERREGLPTDKQALNAEDYVKVQKRIEYGFLEVILINNTRKRDYRLTQEKACKLQLRHLKRECNLMLFMINFLCQVSREKIMALGWWH